MFEGEECEEAEEKPLTLNEELEILQGFPEDFREKLVTDKLREVEAKIRKVKVVLNKRNGIIKVQPADKQPLYRAILEWVTQRDLEPLLARQRRLKALKSMLINKGKAANSAVDKEKAKQTSIIDVAKAHGLELKKIGGRYYAKCPFHPDNHPSLVLYPETNSFFLFFLSNGRRCCEVLHASNWMFF
jgi:hypothetical protein